MVQSFHLDLGMPSFTGGGCTETNKKKENNGTFIKRNTPPNKEQKCVAPFLYFSSHEPIFVLMWKLEMPSKSAEVLHSSERKPLCPGMQKLGSCREAYCTR